MPTRWSERLHAMPYPGALALYRRFEQIITIILTILIAAVIIEATWELLREVFVLLTHKLLDPLDAHALQVVFGQIMTVLIAIEFNHTIVRAAANGQGIVQVRTVILIGVLALARKFIILDPAEYAAPVLFALAAALLVLGVTYWLIRACEHPE